MLSARDLKLPIAPLHGAASFSSYLKILHLICSGQPGQQKDQRVTRSSEHKFRCEEICVPSLQEVDCSWQWLNYHSGTDTEGVYWKVRLGCYQDPSVTTDELPISRQFTNHTVTD